MIYVHLKCTCLLTYVQRHAFMELYVYKVCKYSLDMFAVKGI